MKKIIIDKREWLAFFREFIAVVLGIVLTFWGQGIYDRHEERENVKEALSLVRDELKDNLENLNFAQQAISQEVTAAKFLIRYEKDYTKAPADSLEAFNQVPFMILYLNTTDDAMELLKTSALFSKIDDKELALTIIEAYASIRTAHDMFCGFYDIKKEMVNEASSPKVTSVFNNDDATAIDIWTEMARIPEGQQMLHHIPKIFPDEYQLKPTMQIVQYTIDEIDKYLQQ